MIKKKSIGVALACALALGVWSGSALATPINVNGVHWDSSSPFDLTVGTATLRETSISAIGNVLTGYGQIDKINGSGNFCTGCDLTFTFTYTVKSINGLQVVFDNGTFQFYTQPVGSFNFGDPTSVGGLGSMAWLTLSGHTAPRAGFADPFGQLYATAGGSISQPNSNSSGNGLVNATGGIAAPFLNSNSFSDGIGGFADLNLSSNFSFFPANSCATVTTSLANLCSYPITGGGTLTGRTAVVPEPGTIGMLGLGLGFLGLALRRRRKESDDLA